MRNLAIIPARSGSKGLPNKNIRRLNGKPLLAYSIRCGLDSGLFDEVMVSTDSEEYAGIARTYGAAVPFLRSEATSSDQAGSMDMMKEVLSNYRGMGREFDTVCLLQPTSPLRAAGDIKGAYRLFHEKKGIAVVSVCRAEHPPAWSGKLPESRSLAGFVPIENAGNRQSNGQHFRLNGAIYIWDVAALFEDGYLFREGSYAYIMDNERSIDIDAELDFRIAEFLMGGHGSGQLSVGQEI